MARQSNPTTYAIYSQWTKQPDDDTGFRVEADSPEDALEVARRRGAAWGLGYSKQYIGLVAKPLLVSNPPWVTTLLSRNFTFLEEHSKPEWLPKLEKVKATKSKLTASMPELGCGAYGCVLNTLTPSVVLKVTTDDTEAEFAGTLSKDLAAKICVKYYQVVELAEKHKGRKTYLLWRESADHVGKIGDVLGAAASNLINEQHALAQAAFAALHAGDDATEPLAAWVENVEAMGAQTEVPELHALGRGFAKIYRDQGIFFGDVHDGNVGAVTRGKKTEWVITDPGHVAVVNQ